MSERSVTGPSTRSRPRDGGLESTAEHGLAPARTTTFWLAVLCGAIMLLLMPTVLSSFQLFFATVVMCYVLIAAGLNIVIGYSGQLSIAHAALMGLGAYTATLLMLHANVPYLLAVPVAVIVTTALGFVVGIPALRIRAHYLALATLAFQMIVQTIIWNWEQATGGPNGLRVPPVEIFGMTVGDTSAYWIVGVVVLLFLMMTRNLARSRFGRALIAIRDDDLVAEIMGVNLTRYKTQAFAASAFYAGLGGALFAMTVGHLDPAAFTLWWTVAFIVMVLLGGMGTVLGPILGGVIVGGAPEFFRGFDEHWPIIYFATVIVILIFLPAGMVGGLQRLARRLLPAELVRSKYEAGVRTREASEDTATARVQQATAGGDAATTLPVARGNANTQGPSPLIVEQGSSEHEDGGEEAAGGPLLTVEGVSLRFGGLQALRHVTMGIDRGEISGLIGPNGAGKTTLFNVMTRVLRPHEGSIVFDGKDLLQYRTHEIVGLGLSRTFQNVELCQSLSVAENVILGMHHRLESGVVRCGLRMGKTLTEERQASMAARVLLDELGLLEHANKLATELPLGIQRRIELARALAANPKAILLDEPASGLSQEEASELMQDIRRLQDFGITVLVIEHNVQFVMGLCSQVTVIDKGEIIYHGTAVGAQQDERVIEAYLGSEEREHA